MLKVLWHGEFVDRNKNPMSIEKTIRGEDMDKILFLISHEITLQVKDGNDFVSGERKHISKEE